MARLYVAGSLVALLIGAAWAQESQSERRILTNGRALAVQLRPSDRRIVLPINAAKPNFVMPPVGVSRERFWTELCEFVAVLRVHSVRSHLVHRDDMDIDALTAGRFNQRNVPASEDTANWIVSSIRARVEGVVKGAPVLSEGDELVFQVDGGTATVRGVEVVAIVPWLRPMVPGRRYVVFGKLTGDGKLLRTATYEEPSPFALLVGAGPQDEGDRLETLNIEQALVHLQQEMRR